MRHSLRAQNTADFYRPERDTYKHGYDQGKLREFKRVEKHVYKWNFNSRNTWEKST